MTQDSRFILETVLEQSRKKDYPNLRPDKFFEIFAAQQALKDRRFNLDPSEIESGNIGGENDGGVDGFYLFVNRKSIREDTDPVLFKDQQLNLELVIIQATNRASFEESVPMKFKDFVENCLRLNSDMGKPEIAQLYSEALLNAVKKFHDIYQPSLLMRPKLSVTFYQVSIGEQVDPKVEARAEILKTCLKTFFPTAECRYEYIRGNRLLELFQRQPEYILALDTPKYFEYKSYGCNAYVCVVKIPDFYKFITDSDSLREYMFESNVRDHAPDVKVNKKIRATLQAPTNEDFWWLNNGITILSSDVSFNNGALQVTDPMIVNGLQTSYEIFNHFTSGASKDDQRTIMIRVIANTDLEVSDHIINATNSQTKIDPINLHATEQIHRNIEAALKTVNLYYDRRKNFYRNRGISARQIITISYLAQAVAAIVLQQPNNARGRPTTVADKSYNKLFSDKYPLSLYQKCAQVIQTVNLFLEEKEVPQGTKLNLMFYLAMYVTCGALRSPKPKYHRIASIEIPSITTRMLNSCYEWLEHEYVALGGDDKVAKGPELVEKLKQRLVEQFGRGRKSPQAQLIYEN